MNTKQIFCLGALLSVCFSLCAQSIDLTGTWRFAIDRNDAGIAEQWYQQNLKDSIKLPGVLQSQGYGDAVSKDTPWVLSLYDRNWYMRKDFKQFAEGSEVKVPFLSQPPRHYLGCAWYQRDVDIPADWRGRRVALFLERTRWETTAWLDDEKIGTQDSLVAPHEFELGTPAPGRHRLTILVDNRMKMDYRPDAHAVSDSLGSTWNGIVGRIELVSTSPVWLDSVQAFPDNQKKAVTLKVSIKNVTGKAGQGMLKAGDVQKQVTWDSNGLRTELVVKLKDDAQLWNEFNPALQHITVTLKGDRADDKKDVTFGLCKISTDGSNLLVNGQRSHFRGTHSGGDFPLTGYPATDIDYWHKLFTTCKQWGLNHMRFHSFCPPEAAFAAADELGFYLQPEPGMWNEISPGRPMEKRLYEETDRMIRAYGNHPSFILMSPSNEPKGRWKESLPRWVEHYRTQDPRRLYTTGTGWPLIEAPGHVEGADFLAVHRIGPRLVRGNQAWFGRDYLNSMKGTDVPIIVHELGQWCAYPNYDVIEKFTGYLRPGNYEIFRELMRQKGLVDKDKQFALASGMFQAACYKEEVEANLRTPGLAGFQLLDLHDYLGQGTALVGLLDAFWQEKGYIKASQWTRFCNTTVPLAVMRSYVYTTADAFDIPVMIAHYGPAPLENVNVYWQIRDKRQIVQQGNWKFDRIELGSAQPIGKVSADLSKLTAPGYYSLVIGLEGTPFENDWDFWLYPAASSHEAPAAVVITRSFDEAMKSLQSGQKVLFMPAYNQLKWQSPPIGRVPIFWNRLMGPNWERFLGLLCDNKHPALAKFPTDVYYDWQWQEVLRNCRAVNMDDLPKTLEPIVQGIDDWNRNYKLGILFECSVDKGKLLLCSADLESELDRRPAARQLRESLLQYMASNAFKPAAQLTSQQFLGMQFDNQIMKKLGASASVRSMSNVIDGNPNTFWTTAGRSGSAVHPHELLITFPSPVEMTGLVLMNRQDHREHEGDIRQYRIEISPDGAQWQTLTEGQLESTFDPQTIAFDKKVAAKGLRLVALSGFGNGPSASLAELAVIYAGPPLTDAMIESAASYRRTASATEEMYEAVNPLENSTNPSASLVERVTADSESSTDPAEYALDGNPQTHWHTQWQEAAPKHPHWIQLELKRTIAVMGVTYLPRQDRTNGWIGEYVIEVSSDGKQWQKAAAGKFKPSKDVQVVEFAPIRAGFVRLTALSEQQDQPFTSAAELTIVEQKD
ncbi:MAG: discoidin domain-containing protein [Planctomycetaceae bacterium]|nr:discoidin domain-containing protein [Planctomycetaceae bacterium]